MRHGQPGSSAPNSLHMSFRNPNFPPNFINAENVLEYFCNPANTFYDMASCNQQIKMQNINRPVEECLLNMPGIQYVLWSSQPPLFVICKQRRNNTQNVTPLAYYYVINGLIHQAPDMHSLVQSRLLGAMEPLKDAFETVLNYARYNAAKGYYWEFRSGKHPLRNNRDEPKVQKEEEKPLEARSTNFQQTRTAMLIQQLFAEMPADSALEILEPKAEGEAKADEMPATAEPAAAAAPPRGNVVFIANDRPFAACRRWIEKAADVMSAVKCHPRELIQARTVASWAIGNFLRRLSVPEVGCASVLASFRRQQGIIALDTRVDADIQSLARAKHALEYGRREMFQRKIGSSSHPDCGRSQPLADLSAFAGDATASEQTRDERPNHEHNDESMRTQTTTLERRRQRPRPTAAFGQRRALFAALLLCLSTIVRSAPLRGDVSADDDTPLSIADGFIPYSIGNDTGLREFSRKAFFSLHSTTVEAKLLPPAEEVQMKSLSPAKSRSHRKKGRPGNPRKKVLDGRKTALLAVADPDALRMQQRCEGQKFKQRVKVDGCLTKIVVNRLCHGTCASYFIPRMHSKKLKASFKSCATCAPSDYDFVDVTLDCPGQDPPQVTRRIIKVKQCRCRDVDLSSLNF
ncbi:unnamed protein product [Caenorhabditis auriculariae]|uniref:CTCK domain-containing protein n=1 Tax=Caenorhabditis auriculariae TaxID=2777116 RepID=A0A8S1HPB5_9PELO|nr:unnamed protein product [Caenorhabditis auriculariae]